MATTQAPDPELRRRYKVLRVVVVLAGIVGAFSLIFGALIPVLWPLDTPVDLVSNATDSVLSETLKLFGGATLSTAFIGWLYDRYRDLEQAERKGIEELVAHQGLSFVFARDGDPEFKDFLTKAIDNARAEITCVGMGMGYLYGDANLGSHINAALKKRGRLRVKILFGEPANKALETRVSEEAAASKQDNLEYDVEWPTRFFTHVQTHLSTGLNKTQKARLLVARIPFFPMISVIQLDSLLLFAPYGAPTQRGRHSPWIVVDRAAHSSDLVQFLETYVQEAVAAVAKP